MFLSQNQTTVYGNCDNEKKVSTENFNSHSLNLLQCAQNNGSKSRLIIFCCLSYPASLSSRCSCSLERIFVCASIYCGEIKVFIIRIIESSVECWHISVTVITRNQKCVAQVQNSIFRMKLKGNSIRCAWRVLKICGKPWLLPGGQ